MTAIGWGLELEMIMRLAIAGVLGGIIGFDRSYHAKDAGLRTYFLVATGSALLMVVSQYGFNDFISKSMLGGTDVRLDPSRVAGQIVSGIGFLGAGMIIFQKKVLSGLTTSAGLWTAMGIGMAIGGGLYLIGVAATVLVLIGFELLKLERHRILKVVDFAVSGVVESRGDAEILMEKIHISGVRLLSSSTEKIDGGVGVRFILRGNDKAVSEKELIAIFENVADLKIERQE